jgi:hypothetical protein
MAKKDEDEYILQTYRWTVKVLSEVYKAGGALEALNIPEDLLITMVRNNLSIKYEGKNG